MNFLMLMAALLGIVIILVVLWFVMNDKPLPPELKFVVLVAILLLFVLCLAHTAGCVPGAGPIAP